MKTKILADFQICISVPLILVLSRIEIYKFKMTGSREVKYVKLPAKKMSKIDECLKFLKVKANDIFGETSRKNEP